jgi:ABC-type antimicrobial peptide transport system permease subunit
MRFPPWRSKQQEQLEQEIVSHLEMATRDHLDHGATPDEAANGKVPSILDALRQTNQQISSEQVIYDVQMMDDLVADTLAARRFSMIVLASFATLALVLSTVGTYEVISYTVGQRSHEIGLRVALGASRVDVLRLVLNQGAKLAAIGVVTDLAASLALTQLMGSMLYGVTATDPPTFLGVAVILMLVALAACSIPARRAMRVDPVVALRYE